MRISESEKITTRPKLPDGKHDYGTCVKRIEKGRNL